MAIKGSLVEASLPEVIQLIAYSLKSGCLSVTDGRNFGNIFLREGKIIYATILKRDSRLGDSLLGKRLFQKDVLKQALSVQKSKRKRIGEILVEMGAISRQILEDELKHQIEDALYTMLTWDKGYFNFEEGLLPAPDEQTIQLSSKDLLLRSARRIPTWQEIQERLPPAGTVLVAKKDGKDLELIESEAAVLSLIDGQKSIDEIVKKAGFDFQEACKAVYVLLTAGVVEEPKTHIEKKAASGDEVEHKNMGQACYESLQYDEAEEEFIKVLDGDPEDVVALFYLGMIELARGNDESARGYLQRALAKERRVSILSNLGYTCIRLNLLDEAIGLLEEAQAIDSKNTKVVLNLAIARYKSGESDAAARGFKEALSISDGLITPYLYLGLIEAKAGDVQGAIGLLSDALEKFPHSGALKNNLALLNDSIGEDETAETLYLQALSAKPGDKTLLKNLASLYYRVRLYNAALEYYEQIPESDRDARTSMRLGRVFLFKGDVNNALEEWKRAQALGAENDILRQEIEILSDLVSV
jgi:tetratricopeptide (TPR) repeat protein